MLQDISVLSDKALYFHWNRNETFPIQSQQVSREYFFEQTQKKTENQLSVPLLCSGEPFEASAKLTAHYFLC